MRSTPHRPGPTTRWANHIYRMPPPWPWYKSFGFAALVVTAAALLIRLAGPMGPVTPALLLFMACVVAARVVGFSASLLSVGLGAIAYRFLQPGWTPYTHLVTFVIVSVLSCAVTATLRTTRIHLARVLDSISDAFAVIDRSWRVQFVNRRAAELVRRSADDLIGRHLFDVFPELAQSTIMQRLEHAHSERRPLQLESYYAPLDLWFEATLVVTPDGVLAFARDITGRKKDEERLRSSLEIVSNSNQDLRHFARAVSHDYTQPLSAIVAFAELIRGETDGATQRHAQKILELINKASLMLRLYSEFSRPGDGLPFFTPMSLSSVLQRTEAEFADLFRRSHVEIVYEDMPTVNGHGELLFLFFRHLVSLVLSSRSAAGVVIRITAERRDDEWVVRVLPRYRGPIEPGFRTDDSLARGRVAICRGIIERHDGRFWTEVDESGSTIVSFSLPAVRAELARASS